MGALPGLRAARFAQVARGEEALYADLVKAWDRCERWLWQALGLKDPTQTQAVKEAFDFGPEAQAEFDRAVRWFAYEVMGQAKDAEAYSMPNYGNMGSGAPGGEEPILTPHQRTGFTVGIARAVELLDEGTAKLAGGRNQDAMREMMRTAFLRLSNGARFTLTGVLTDTDIPGGSVRDYLLAAMAKGTNPLVVAGELKRRFTEIRTYNWARLARTEIAFAQNAGMRGEYRANGYTEPAGVQYPPYHPHCVCGCTLDMERGFVVPDVAATACQVCQAAKLDAIVLIGAYRGKGMPVGV